MEKYSDKFLKLVDDGIIFKAPVTVWATHHPEIFNHVFSNRDIDPAHVAEIVKSIKTYGPINGKRDLSTEGNLTLFDGQHTLEALKKLNLPITFQIDDRLNEDAMVALNNTHKGWSFMMYIRHFSKRGSADYQRVENLIDKYHGIFAPTVITGIILGKSNIDPIRHGRMICSKEDAKRASNDLAWLAPYAKKAKTIRSQGGSLMGFFKVLIFMHRYEKIDDARMKRKVLDKLGVKYPFPSYSKDDDWARYIDEKFYNSGRCEKVPFVDAYRMYRANRKKNKKSASVETNAEE